MRKTSLILMAAVMAGPALVFTACEVDDSLPTRPRVALPFVDPKAQDNAEHHALEHDKQEAPAGVGQEFPGQSNAGMGDRSIVTLDDAATVPAAAPAAAPTAAAQPAQPTGWDVIGHYQGPTTDFNRDIYNKGPIPHLPEVPGSVPMAGSARVPGTGWSIDYSWGQVLPLQDYPHRAWPEITSHYLTANVKHDPVYYFNLQDVMPTGPTTGTYKGDWVSNVYEVPWFYLNTTALPVLMVLEPPLAPRTTQEISQDPNYRGFLPPAGAIVPTPAPGELRWEYPFLNPDGSVKETYEPAARPAATTAP